jgi:hypothetical protein
MNYQKGFKEKGERFIIEMEETLKKEKMKLIFNDMKLEDK